ncbi:type I polyketide synthase [Sorangium sp. So ce429]
MPTRDYAALMKQALLKIEETESKLKALKQAATEPIAIVSVACRFPGGATTPERYWDVLSQKREVATLVPKSRWDVDAYYDADLEARGKTYSRKACFVDDVEQFDADLFGITPREAELMDPQQRLLLEVSWEAFERAGLPLADLKGSRTGVFLGASSDDYFHLVTRDPRMIDAHTGTGTALSVVAGRLSYVFGLRGPSLSIDTACSASLVAVHMACQSLRHGESELAIAGGVSLMLSPTMALIEARTRMLSSDGSCKTFDARADGVVRGEGVGVVVLKRLSDALAAGDAVIAVIRGSATNQNGRSGGLTVPNGIAQQALVRDALAQSGVRPEEVGYVEAHGTGTALGDPIEAEALGAVLGAARAAGDPLWIGSAKATVGHLEAAAGVAGLIKLALMLQRGLIPPNMHLETRNPRIAWDDWRLDVPKEMVAWPRRGGPRIGGVSAFGFCGTNAHVVVEEAPAPQGDAAERAAPPHLLLPLSAGSDEALRALALRYADHLRREPGASAVDVCFTASAGRTHLARRMAVVADDLAGAALALEQAARAPSLGQVEDAGAGAYIAVGRASGGAAPKIAWAFGGQGAYQPGMGRELYERERTFRELVDEVSERAEAACGRPLDGLGAPRGGGAAPARDAVTTQLSLFALQYAQAGLWRRWGIEPDYVTGHSLGEIAAACVAGVFSLEDALTLVTLRARLIQSLRVSGGMVSVFAGEDWGRRAIAGEAQLDVAAINGPALIVVSGELGALERLLQACGAAGVRAQRLHVDHAFHSPLIDPLLAELERGARAIAYQPPSIELVSTVTGGLASDEVACADYWVQHLRRPVRFMDAVRTLSGLGVRTFVEMGPRPVLSTLGRDLEPGSDCVWLPTMVPGREHRAALETLAALYSRGASPRWPEIYRHAAAKKLVLPTYPFQHKPYWHARAPGDVVPAPAPRDDGGHPLLGSRLHVARGADKRAVFERRVRPDDPAFLKHHRVFGAVVFPGAGYLEMALSAGSRLLRTDALALEDVAFLQPMLLDEDKPRVVQTHLEPLATGGYSFEIFSAAPGAEDQELRWTQHVSGKVRAGSGADLGDGARLPSLQPMVALSVDDLYARASRSGVDFGAAFKGVEQLWKQGQAVVGRARLPLQLAAEEARYFVHPALLDACLQVVGASFDAEVAGEAYLPARLGRLEVRARPGVELWCHAQGSAGPEGSFRIGARVFGEAGRLVLDVEALELRRSRELRSAAQETQGWLYEVAWRPAGKARSERRDLPGVAEVARSVGGQAPDAALLERIRAFELGLAELEDASVQYVLSALRSLGWSPALREVFSTDQLARRLGVARRFDRLLGRMLEMLAEEGWIRRRGDGWETVALPPASDQGPRVQRLGEAHPAVRNEASVLLRCGSSLAGVLRGDVDPLTLLFPGGDTGVVHALYQAPLVQLKNDVIRRVIAAVLARTASSGGLRFLEVGAGTGETTAHVLPCLPAVGTEYVFSDVSPVFINRASERFRAYPFLRTALVDIEKEPPSGASGLGTFDVVIASNVVHTTKDLRATIGNLRRFLSPRGILVFMEGTQALRWVDLSFGLTEGWWRFEDADVRPSYPLLTAERWRSLLAECGLQQPVVVPTRADGLRTLEQQAVLLAEEPAQPLADEGRAWLLLADAADAGEQLGAMLARHGQRPVVVTRGAEGAAIHGGAPELAGLRFDLGSADGFRSLLRALDQHGLRPDGVVHLWSLDAVKGDDFDTSELRYASRHGCQSALFLLQALVEAYGERPPGLWLVTGGSQAAREGDTVDGVAHAGVWGLGRVIAREHPELSCRRIDLDARPGEADIRALFDEIQLRSQEDEVALRGGERYVPRVVRRAEAARSAARRGAPRPSFHGPGDALRADGTYVVTGAFGGLGLRVAEWMVERGARNLGLLGRRPPGAEAAQVIERLAQRGARVREILVDVSNEGRLASALAELQASMPPLRGVVHSVGAIDDGILQNLTWERFERVLAPKVEGAWNLHRLTRGMELDFFVLFSSAVALLSAWGQANHTAANTFLDALSHHRRARGLPALTIDWGAWDQVGAAARPEADQKMRDLGMGTIPPDAGLRVLEQLLSEGAVQTGVMPIDWSQFARKLRWSPLVSEVLSDAGEEERAEPELLHRLEQAGPAQRRALLREHVREQIARVMHLSDPSQISEQRRLFTMGLDSLMSVELKNNLSKSLGKPLRATLVFDFPTLGALVEHLSELLPGAERPASAAPAGAPRDAGRQEFNEIEPLSPGELEAIIDSEFNAITD